MESVELGHVKISIYFLGFMSKGRGLCGVTFEIEFATRIDSNQAVYSVLILSTLTLSHTLKFYTSMYSIYFDSKVQSSQQIQVG